MSEIRVSEIRVSEIRGSEIRVSEIRVSEIRISSNHRELHGAIFTTEVEMTSFFGRQCQVQFSVVSFERFAFFLALCKSLRCFSVRLQTNLSEDVPFDKHLFQTHASSRLNRLNHISIHTDTSQNEWFE